MNHSVALKSSNDKTMKKLVSLLLVTLIAIMAVPARLSASAVVVSGDDNFVKVRVTLYDVKKKNYRQEAINEALKMLLFRGAPDTKFNKPLCGSDEAEIMGKNANYFNSLFGYRYDTFVSAFIPQVAGKKDETGKKAWIADVTVNARQLRDDLTSQKIIRKFGL